MIDSVKGQLTDWQYGRSIIKCFITRLADVELDKLFPRVNLNTIRKQCEELIQIQTCYVEALKTGRIQFNTIPLGDVSKDVLLEQMNKLDNMLIQYVEIFKGDEIIEWFGEKWSINQHLSAMIGHEQMHIGQIIAFCYCVNIEIPIEIVNKMALDG